MQRTILTLFIGLIIGIGLTIGYNNLTTKASRDFMNFQKEVEIKIQLRKG